MDHFQGVNNQERFNNDMLNELRQIRQLLERNAQAFETANKGGTIGGDVDQLSQRVNSKVRRSQSR